MKKLKNKIFWIINIILSLFLITILFIFNYQYYNREKTIINQNLFRMKNEVFNKNFQHKNNGVFSRKIDSFDNIENELNELETPKRFIDAKIYTILLDQDNNIFEIVSHTEDGMTNDNITTIATEIINKNVESKIYIGNLYFHNYSYNYEAQNRITLIDTTDVRARLITSFEITVLIFLFAEIVIIAISKLLSNWIIKPIEITFNKQKQFIADASHELKTPLSVIIACSEALEEDKKEHKWIETIQSESERMSKLITNLLDLAKVEDESIKKLYEEINLSKLIEKSILTLESLIYEKNIKLDYHIDENIKYKCDSDEIKQLISILMDNAIKHSCTKGEIVFELKNERNNIILKVKNKGNPIPKGEEEKIFERFYRGDKSRNRDANRYGLGLAIAKGIVTNHNGNISASSDKDYTTFTVLLKK